MSYVDINTYVMEKTVLKKRKLNEYYYWLIYISIIGCAFAAYYVFIAS